MKRQGANLPHWTRNGGIYSVTFRLADSMPKERLADWISERNDIVDTAKLTGRSLSAHERLDLLRLHTKHIEAYLRSGRGSCFMQQPEVADIVSATIKFFEGKRYKLFAWCVMPNHVHVVVQPFPNVSLSSILHSWKTFSARKSNILLKREGSFWQPEYFDRLIRSHDELRYVIEYVWSNPELAGKYNWRWRWKTADVETIHDPTATRAVSPLAHAPEEHATPL